MALGRKRISLPFALDETYGLWPATSIACEVPGRETEVPEPSVKLRLDGIAFPSGRDLTRFCDDLGEDFDRVEWKQD